MLRFITFVATVFAFNTAFADSVSGILIGSIDRVMERDTPVQFKEGDAFSATFKAVDGKRVKMNPDALNYIWTQPNPDNDSSTIGTFTVRVDSTDIALMNASLGVMHDDGNDQFTIRVRCWSGNVCRFTGGMTSAAIQASKSKIPDPSPDAIDQSYALDALAELAASGEVKMLLKFGGSSVVININEITRD